ncbi:MAG: response regulator transcription factor [Acidimicrobiia bacterium]|nr:response regulator transcription factor [Acidimicrobiia bacterium]
MRILVIEDDSTVATALDRGLAAEGFDVDLAHDGDSGFWMATETEYGAILLDVMLPGRNGFRVCADLRHEGIETPILMLTAKSGEYDEAEGLDAGADDYLTKPFSFVVLAARIRAMLRRSGPRHAVLQVLGDLAIDFDRRSCVRAGQDVSLTNREFTLLEVLARQPDVVCSKEFLLDQVWGPDFTGSSNIVEVYVGYLRRKIDFGHERSVIQTVHGHGYRLAS